MCSVAAASAGARRGRLHGLDVVDAHQADLPLAVEGVQPAVDPHPLPLAQRRPLGRAQVDPHAARGVLDVDLIVGEHVGQHRHLSFQRQARAVGQAAGAGNGQCAGRSHQPTAPDDYRAIMQLGLGEEQSL